MLFDTSTWVEFFKGTEKGKKVKKLLLDGIPVYTCPITFAEISNWCCKNNEEPEGYIQKMKKLSKTLDIRDDVLVASGRKYYYIRQKNKKISLIDVIIYTTAAFHDVGLLTKDLDFRGLPKVEFL